MTDLIRRLRKHDGRLVLLVEEAADALEAALAATPAETLERIAELQYEAGMYQCLYENSQKRLAATPALADDERVLTSEITRLRKENSELASRLLDATPAVGGEITDALLFACDEAACHEDSMFYEIFAMDGRWDIIRAILKAAQLTLMGDADLTHYEADAESVLAASQPPVGGEATAYDGCYPQSDYPSTLSTAQPASPLRELATNDLTEIMKLASDDRVSAEALGIRLRALWSDV